MRHSESVTDRFRASESRLVAVALKETPGFPASSLSKRSGRVSSRFEKTDTLSLDYGGILLTQMENVYC